MVVIRLVKQNKSAIVLCVLIYIPLWFTVGIFKSSEKSDQSQHLSPSTASFYRLFEHLSTFHLNLVLIDPVLLEHLFIRQLSFKQFNQTLITLGIVDASVSTIDRVLTQGEFSIRRSDSPSINTDTSLDHLFIEFNQHVIQLAVLHKVNTYYLIRPSLASLPAGITLAYGDRLRVIEPTETNVINDSLAFVYPRNVSHFLWLYETSEFLECNQTMAYQMETEFNLHQNATQLDLTVKPMRDIVSGLDRLHKRYWLAGGTLLGWYRHCGLIPFTRDVDFGLFAEEYDESIRQYFLGNPVAYLWGALGLVNDSLEFRLFTGLYTFDLFWAYREDDHRWCGYQIQRIKYRRTLPLVESLCSADLFGYRFSVPCSPVEYLNNEYGAEQWRTPSESNYTWTNVKYHSMWNDVSWMYATRLYTPQGKLRTDKYAIDWIANHFDYLLTSIPSFLNVVPTRTVTLPPRKKQLYSLKEIMNV